MAVAFFSSSAPAEIVSASLTVFDRTAIVRSDLLNAVTFAAASDSRIEPRTTRATSSIPRTMPITPCAKNDAFDASAVGEPKMPGQRGIPRKSTAVRTDVAIAWRTTVCDAHERPLESVRVFVSSSCDASSMSTAILPCSRRLFDIVRVAEGEQDALWLGREQREADAETRARSSR